MIEALQETLSQVPPSDFQAVYIHDLGKILMGVKTGRPFAIDNYDPKE